jgi:hypothetical protein
MASRVVIRDVAHDRRDARERLQAVHVDVGSRPIPLRHR